MHVTRVPPSPKGQKKKLLGNCPTWGAALLGSRLASSRGHSRGGEAESPSRSVTIRAYVYVYICICFFSALLCLACQKWGTRGGTWISPFDELLFQEGASNRCNGRGKGTNKFVFNIFLLTPVSQEGKHTTLNLARHHIRLYMRLYADNYLNRVEKNCRPFPAVHPFADQLKWEGRPKELHSYYG